MTHSRLGTCMGQDLDGDQVTKGAKRRADDRADWGHYRSLYTIIG
jgi:hypothetical protein